MLDIIKANNPWLCTINTLVFDEKNELEQIWVFSITLKDEMVSAVIRCN